MRQGTRPGTLGQHRPPERLEPLLLRRLEAPPEVTWQVLEAAAVQGEAFAVRPWRPRCNGRCTVDSGCETLGAHGQLVTPCLVCLAGWHGERGRSVSARLYRVVLDEHVREGATLHRHAQWGTAGGGDWGPGGQIAAELVKRSTPSGGAMPNGRPLSQ